MRRLLKRIIGTLTITFGLLALVGVKLAVNAAEQYGKYTVTNTVSTSTAIWDFTDVDTMPSGNVTVKSLTDDALYGLGGDITKGITLKGTEKNISNNKTGVLYVPVPSADAEGSITLLGSSSNNARTMTLAVVTQNEGSTLSDKTYIYSSLATTISFDSSYVTTEGGAYWLKFDPNGQEVKLKSITVALTSTTQYTETAATVNVNIYDGNSLLKTYEIEKGTAFTNSVNIWGYASTSLYTDDELTNEYDGSVISEDTSLYIDKVVDTTDYGTNLTAEMIAKISSVYNASSEIVITDYYTKSSGAIFTSSYATVKNTESTSLIINVPEGGMDITVSCSNGGSSVRSVYLYQNTYGSNAVADFTTEFEASNYNAVNATATLAEGTYYLSGTDNVRVYSITMTPSVAAQIADSANLAASNSTGESTTIVGTTAVRFVGRITGVDELDITSIEATITGDSSVNKTFTTVYTAITNISGCEAADNTYYFYYTIYGVTAEYNDKTISFTYTVTFADGSVKTLATANTYTINL